MNHIPQTSQFSCPCCGNTIATAAPVDMVKDKISRGHNERIFSLLASRLGRFVSKDAIVEHIYGDDPDGGPDRADHVVSVLVNKLKNSIEPYGWTIKSIGRGSGNKAHYSLAPIEVTP